MSSSLAIRSVDKFFPSAQRGQPVQVLHDFSFEANPGEFVVFLGASGCGKSTALRLIAGLESPQSGEILIDGQVVNDVPPARRRLAMVFQSYALFPHLSVAENIIFGLRVRRVPRRERDSRLMKAAEQLELGDLLQRKPAQLSGGQRQRVALGRALVSGASLILMDEPLSNLDAKLRQQMRSELRALQRRLGLTVIYVTHDQIEAMTMADKVVVMRQGRVDQIADPLTLYRAPARAEVARFIGSPPMNLIRCVATDAGFSVVGARDTVLAVRRAGIAPGREVLVGIRPEDLVLEGSEITLRGRLDGVELIGADQLVKLHVGGPEPLVARIHNGTRVEEGQSYALGLRAADTHLFDAASGERIH
ncbi:MAG: ABC transporter ATP-binding protein [Rhodobacteraceae bacterium]|nr:ABC transporter ATP-binding protein [Paracoccaceae bacterium]